MIREIVFDPYLPLLVLAVIAALAAVLVVFAAWRGLRGWPWRALAVAGILAALANPSLQQEVREPLTDIVVLVVDESASQDLSTRAEQVADARAQIEVAIARMPNTELRVVSVGDADDNRGTLLMTRLSEALANEPRGRLAGAILLSDGQLHDAQVAPDLPAPLHLLLTGEPEDWDRRLVIENAPSFAILDEEVVLTLSVEDQGAVPESAAAGRRSSCLLMATRRRHSRSPRAVRWRCP